MSENNSNIYINNTGIIFTGLVSYVDQDGGGICNASISSTSVLPDVIVEQKAVQVEIVKN